MAGLFGALVAPRRKDGAVVGSELFGLGGGSTSSGVPVNSVTGLKAPALLACINVIAEDVAKLPVRMFRRLPNGGKVEITDHYLARILDKPNAWQTRFEFVEMMMGALLLRSNAFACIIRDDRGRPEQLIPVHPDRVTLYEAPGGEWFWMVTRQGLHEMAVLSSLPIMVANEDMLHLTWLSTTRSLLGTSRVDLIRESVGISVAQEQHLARLLGQGARPGGVLQTEQKLPKEVLDRIQAAWQESHGGWRAGGRTAILEGGLTWTAMEMDLESAEFNEGRQWQLNEIARVFRIPPHKLGLPVEGNASSLIQYEQAYLNDCVSTWCDRWVPRLQELGDIDGRQFFVEFDYDHLLSADIKTAIDAARAGVGSAILTPNEARRRLGLPDDPDGGWLLQPSGMVRLGTSPGSGSGPGSNTTGRPADGGSGDPSADGDFPL